jgi:hypothetical protein
MADKRRLTPEELAIAVKCYVAGNTPLDRLPYTFEFDDLWQRVNAGLKVPLSKNELWLVLSNARKIKKLPALRKRGGGNPPPL